MMKTGWWEVKFELTLEGEEVRWDDLDECTQEHIAEMIKEGYLGGEIVIEDDDDVDDGVGKYPYLDNIADDYNKLMNLVKDVKSLKDIEELVANKSFSISEIEINGMSVGFYKERLEQGFASDIEWIRYESFGCLDYIYVFTDRSRLPVFDVALETEGHIFENMTIADIDDMESECWEDVVRKHMNERDE